MNYLYILGIKPLLVIPFANIFSHPVGCLSLLSSFIYLFIYFLVSFLVQKLVILIMSHLFIFSFISIPFGD